MTVKIMIATVEWTKVVDLTEITQSEDIQPSELL